MAKKKEIQILKNLDGKLLKQEHNKCIWLGAKQGNFYYWYFWVKGAQSEYRA